MDELVRWLSEQLDEDERIARAATAGPWRQHDTHLGQYGHTATVLSGERNDTDLRAWLPSMSQESWDETRNVWADAVHIAAHDPARVLREIAAKRRILEIHNVVGGWENEDGQDIGLGCDECGYSAEYSDRGGWCETVRLLALPYADRPTYREEWAP